MPSLLTQFPTDDEPPMDEGFLVQARYYLSNIGMYVRQLEQAPDTSSALEEAFRSTHTLSVDASQMGYLRLARIGASMEDVFGDALDEILHLDRAAFDVLHRSLERANLLLEVMKTGNGDAGRIDAENAADHAAFRQQHRDMPIVKDAEIKQWPPSSEAQAAEEERATMAQLTVYVRTIHEAPTAVGWAGQRTLTIDRPEQAGGMGLGYSGGELLFLSIGACYCNDIFREADKRGMVVKSVQVEVSGDWGGEPVRAQNVTFSAKVEAEASEAEIRALMEHTDRVAEIPNSLRMGTPVRLAQAQAISLPPTPEA